MNNQKALEATLKQSKDAMDASDKQSSTALDAAIKSSQLDQRAWVGVLATTYIDFTESTPWRVTEIFFNSGRTPAQNVEASAMFITSPVPIRGPRPQDIKQLVFSRAQSIAPQTRYNQNLGYSFPAEISSSFEKNGAQTLVSQYQFIKNKQLFLYYFGILKYDDIFGNHRETQFCIYLANPDTKEVGICDAFNDLS
jgi:hypothetical protein